jgi:hypothetical protein
VIVASVVAIFQKWIRLFIDLLYIYIDCYFSFVVNIIVSRSLLFYFYYLSQKRLNINLQKNLTSRERSYCYQKLLLVHITNCLGSFGYLLFDGYIFDMNTMPTWCLEDVILYDTLYWHQKV